MAQRPGRLPVGLSGAFRGGTRARYTTPFGRCLRPRPRRKRRRCGPASVAQCATCMYTIYKICSQSRGRSTAHRFRSCRHGRAPLPDLWERQWRLQERQWRCRRTKDRSCGALHTRTGQASARCRLSEWPGAADRPRAWSEPVVPRTRPVRRAGVPPWSRLALYSRPRAREAR